MAGRSARGYTVGIPLPLSRRPLPRAGSATAPETGLRRSNGTNRAPQSKSEPRAAGVWSLWVKTSSRLRNALVDGLHCLNSGQLKMQNRIHSYVDAQISRLGGPNVHEIPPNAPLRRCITTSAMACDAVSTVEIDSTIVAFSEAIAKPPIPALMSAVSRSLTSASKSHDSSPPATRSAPTLLVLRV